MQVCEWQLLDEFHGRPKVLGRLTRKADNHISADGSIGKRAANKIYPFSIKLRAIPPVHRPQDTVRPGLQRNVKITRDTAGLGDERHEIRGNVLRLNRAKA